MAGLYLFGFLHSAHPTKGTVVNKDSGMHFGASLAAMIPPLTGFPLPLGLIASALEVRLWKRPPHSRR